MTAGRTNHTLFVGAVPEPVAELPTIPEAVMHNRPDFTLSTCGTAACLTLNGGRAWVLQRYLDRALNCDPEAPKWLFELSDCLNPEPVPQPRSRPGTDINGYRPVTSTPE